MDAGRHGAIRERLVSSASAADTEVMRARSRISLVTVACLAALALVPAQAEGRILLGAYGDLGRFDRLTGQNSSTRLHFPSWGQGQVWEDRDPSFLNKFGPRPMISLTMSKAGVPYITPREVARGRGDAHLIGLARTAARSGRKFFIRPYAEMTGHWNSYCAYNANGSRRGPAYRQRWLRQAFRRTYIIMHGGTAAEMSAKLRALGLPGVRGDVPANPYPNMTVVWNPQGISNPSVRGNRARAYWPGRRYVDMVANDLYTRTGTMSWAANEALYRAYPRKPYAIGEWGLTGVDAPMAVRRVARFARTHRRVRLLVFFNGRPGTPWNLGTKPRSLAAYRRYIVPLGR
jgi:hypothetical protein